MQEVEYSDDDEEREAKARRKKGKGGKQRGDADGVWVVNICNILFRCVVAYWRILGGCEIQSIPYSNGKELLRLRMTRLGMAFTATRFCVALDINNHLACKAYNTNMPSAGWFYPVDIRST